MPTVAPIDKSRPSSTPDSVRVIKAVTNANPTNSVVQTQTPPAPSSLEAAVLTSETSVHSDTQEPSGSEANKPISPQYAALARKESALRTKEKEFQAKEAAFKSQEAEYLEAKAFKEKLKADPLTALNEIGITYDQLVEAAVNQPNPELKAVNDKLKSIEEAQKRYQEESKKASDTQRQSAITQITHDATDIVESNPEFQTIKETESVQDVVDLIVKTFDESGKLLSVEQAAKQVEDSLLTEALRIANLTKVKAKLQPPVEEPKLQSIKTQQPPQAKTLTNSITSNRKLTPRERAIMAFTGQKF